MRYVIIREMVKCPRKRAFIGRGWCQWSCKYGEKGEGGGTESTAVCNYKKREEKHGQTHEGSV